MTKSESTDSTEMVMKNYFIALSALALSVFIAVASAAYGYGEMQGRVAELEHLVASMEVLHGTTNDRQWTKIGETNKAVSEINAKLSAVEAQLVLIIDLLRQQKRTNREFEQE